MPTYSVGGQAVIEGVMMRGEREWSVAVRSPEGEIIRKKEPAGSLIERYPILRKPIIRGVVSLVETLALGIKALSFSATASLGGEQEEISGKEWAGTMALALVLVVALFMVAPFYLTRFLTHVSGHIVFAIIEGVFRIAIFLAYITFISRLKDIQRVFQYHGAEHKSIHALEAGEELTPQNAAKYSTLHVRCGTSFLLIVMVVAIFTFSFLPTNSILTRVFGKILLIPVIAGIAYELVKLASKHPNSRILNAIVWPGLMLQKLTTREPDLDQLEVAIAALKDVVEVEQAEPTTI